MGKVFGKFHRSIWRKLADTMLDADHMQISTGQVADNLDEMFSQIDHEKVKEIKLSIIATWVVLGGPIFHWGSRNFRKKRIENRMRRWRVDLLQDMARIRGIVYAGYYGHWLNDSDGNEGSEALNAENPVLQSLNFTLPENRQRDGTPDSPAVKPPTPKRDLPQSAFVNPDAIPLDADIIVIGSGAGGAVAAYNLTQQGYKVLVVEKGAHFPSDKITTHELAMSSRIFKDGAIQTSRNRDIIVFQGEAVGGSTVINNGICLRMTPNPLTHPQAENILDKWHSLGAPVRLDDLNASYDEVTAFLGIKEVHHRLGLNNGQHLLNAWEAYLPTSQDPMDKAAIANWFSKNWLPYSDHVHCVASGYCNTGCPYGYKNAMPESYLSYASSTPEKPARILTDTIAERIIFDNKTDEQGRKNATGVVITLKNGTQYTVPVAKGVVVAAGTIASSNIMIASGWHHAGKGISLNIASPVPALMPYEVRAWDEDQMATYIDRGDFLLESHFQPPMSMATLVPGWFEDHFQRMLNYNFLASAGVLFPADRRGHIKKGKLSFDVPEADLVVLRRAFTLLTHLHFMAGAKEVYPATLSGDTMLREDYPTKESIADYFQHYIRDADNVVLSSSHPHGGNAINQSADKGIVDLDQKVHGTQNVLVADASVMPSCIRVNAQLTTMAMSNRVTKAKNGARTFG